MKKENEKLIEQCNSKRSNIYYRLNQLEDITGLSPRMLKYKMKDIKKKYANIPSLLSKKGKSWRIHNSIISEFMPIRKRKSYTESSYQWRTYVSWNPKENYTADYHVQLITEIKNEMPERLIKYVVEIDGRGHNHVHFVTDATLDATQRAVDKILTKYFDKTEIVRKVSKVINSYSSISYHDKAPILNGVI